MVAVIGLRVTAATVVDEVTAGADRGTMLNEVAAVAVPAMVCTLTAPPSDPEGTVTTTSVGEPDTTVAAWPPTRTTGAPPRSVPAMVSCSPMASRLAESDEITGTGVSAETRQPRVASQLNATLENSAWTR